MKKPFVTAPYEEETAHRICTYTCHDPNGDIIFRETLSENHQGDFYLIRETAVSNDGSNTPDPSHQKQGHICVSISADSVLTWLAIRFPPEISMEIARNNDDLCIQINSATSETLINCIKAEKEIAKTNINIERNPVMNTPTLQFRFSNMRLEIIFDGTVYSYEDEEELRDAVFYSALSITNYMDEEDKDIQKTIKQQIHDSLSFRSTEQKKYVYDPDDLPCSFFTELSRTILMTANDPFTREYEGKNTLIHFDSSLSFDPATGQCYPFLPIVRGLEDGLYYTVTDFARKTGDDCFSKDDQFAYFLDTDGYPYWADLCTDASEAVLLHRMFFDLHYDEYKKNLIV